MGHNNKGVHTCSLICKTDTDVSLVKYFRAIEHNAEDNNDYGCDGNDYDYVRLCMGPNLILSV